MIEFGCITCGRFLRVSEDKAGKKGRCPDCGSTIQVPSPDDHEIDFEDNVTLHYPLSELATLIDLSLAGGVDHIDSYKPLNGDLIAVIVACDEGRTQTVACAYVNDDIPYVLLHSSLGNYFKLQHSKNDLFNLLVDASNQPFSSISASADGEISARHKVDTLQTEWSQILAIITLLGRHADMLEKKYFSVDVG